jgi:hypothetical protein
MERQAMMEVGLLFRIMGILHSVLLQAEEL